MAPDRGTELYRCGVLPLTTAFTRHSLEPCGSKASQSYTVRLRGRREGRREREMYFVHFMMGDYNNLIYRNHIEKWWVIKI